MKNQVIILMYLMILMSTVFNSASMGAIPSAERSALIDFYHSTGGDNWSNNENWLGSEGTECSWHGIVCDFDNNVIGIYLEQSNLSGKIPASIENIPYLMELDLSDNQLTQVPPQVGNLFFLSTFDLSNNALNSLPPEIGNLTDLFQINLSNNNITSIPSEIGNLSYLSDLDVSYNQISSIPPEIADLIDLQMLNLSNNQITRLPTEIGNLNNLYILNLSHNYLSSIPKEIGNLTSLQSIEFSNNQLTSLPAEIGNLSPHGLDLSYNKISSLPAAIGNLTRLRDMNVSFNQLNQLPEEIGLLTDLRYLYLSNNQLSNLPSEIVNLTQLEEIDLSFNQLTQLPDEIGNLIYLKKVNLTLNQLTSLPDTFGNLTHLKWLDISLNNLHSLPATMGNLYHLETLNLSGNQLSQFNSELKHLINLRELNISDNQLTKIPDEIKDLVSLQKIHISNNSLFSVTERLGDLNNLQELDLSYNQLPDLPDEMKNLLNLRKLNVSNNVLQRIPYEIGRISNLHEIDLSANQIESIEDDIKNFKHVVSLNLSSNRISYIFEGIGELVNLEYLFLSDNWFSEIPESFNNLQKLKYLAISGNYLDRIPEMIFSFDKLRYLSMANNRLEQNIPKEIGNLKELFFLDLSSNQLVGDIPLTVLNLNKLINLNIYWNGLYTTSPLVNHFISNKNKDWQSTQTIAPDDLMISERFNNKTSVTLSWTPVSYVKDEGKYYIYCSETRDGLNNSINRVKETEKQNNTITIDNLNPDEHYYFSIQTVTQRHINNNNVVNSELSGEISDLDIVSISKISSKENKLSYTVGDSIPISIFFNHPVSLENGNLVLGLTTGNSERTVTISEINDSTIATGTYVVQEGDRSEDLNVEYVTLSDDAILKSSTNKTIDLSVPLAGNLADLNNLRIDGVRPDLNILIPENSTCIKYIEQIKGTAFDESNEFIVQLNIKKGNLYYDLDLGIWHPYEIWFIPEGKENWNQHIGEAVFENTVSYTITASVEDFAGNKTEKQTAFTYGKQKSTIQCELSEYQVILGKSILISGQISPPENMTGEAVSLELTSPSGNSFYRNVHANIDGSFQYAVTCDDMTSAGLWMVQSSWNGNNCLEPAMSQPQEITLLMGSSRIYLDVTREAIRLGDSLSISGKLTPQPNCGADISDMEIMLVMTSPAGSKKIEFILTNDRFGHFQLRDYMGFDELGEWKVQAIFNRNDAYLQSISEITSVQVSVSAGYAIIVQGAISGNEGIQSHNKTTNYVYNQFKLRGLQDNDKLDDIMYFNYDTLQEGVDNKPSKSGIKHAITSWSQEKMNEKPANLYIVMIDHGMEDTFYIFPDDPIRSTDLANWLNTLQQGLEGHAKDQKIIIILGFCHSGSFIDDLSGDKRIIITSAAHDEFSFKGPLDKDNIREGEFFISEFFKNVSLGQSIYNCFKEAVDLTERFTSKISHSSINAPPYYDTAFQHPLLDDNGDGKGSNDISQVNSDGGNSDKIIIGISTLTGNAPGDVSLLKVSDTIFIDDSDQASEDIFWARVDNNDRLLSAWIEIKAPQYNILEASSQSGQSSLDLPKIVYSRYNANLDRYEWDLQDIKNQTDIKNREDFSEPGLYQIFYFAKDTITNNVSSFMETNVYKNTAGNESPQSFSIVFPVDGITMTSKGILGDCRFDSDPNCYTMLQWEETIDPDNDRFAYRVCFSKDDPAFSIFENQFITEEILYNFIPLDLPDLWDGHTIYWKVQAIDYFGAMTESDVKTFKLNNYNNPPRGTFMGQVRDSFSKKSINRATVKVGTKPIRTARGYYSGVLKPGIYDIEVTSSDYKPSYLYGVKLENDQIITLDFELLPFTAQIQGDLNGDAFIGLLDAILGLKILSCQETDVIGDFYNTHKVGLKEVLFIMLHLAED